MQEFCAHHRQIHEECAGALELRHFSSVAISKNEERTATGIVIGRNYDPAGILKVYMIDSSTVVNRAKLKAPYRRAAPSCGVSM
jgi:hypothetical protein